MDLTVVALLVVAVAAIVVIGWRTRRGAGAAPFDDALPVSGATSSKYDTTLGELKEMREALRPVVHSRVDHVVHAQGAPRTGRGRHTR